MDLRYDTDVVLCPNCGSEFQPHVTHCIDCGTPTQSGLSLTDRQRIELARRGFSLPPASEAFSVRIAELGWAEKLGNLLEENGIPCRLEVFEDSRRHIEYSVCVAAEDFERALELDREHLLKEVPDFAAALSDLSFSADQCPACSAQVSSESTECQSCGLARIIGEEADEESE